MRNEQYRQKKRTFLTLLPLDKRLQRKQAEWQEVEEPQSIILNFYYVLAHLPTEYKKLSIEGQKRMMRIVAKEVKLDMLSPHLFRLYIVWENGIALRPDVALIWRGVTPNICEEWSEEEDNMMRSYYPEKPQIERMQAFPHRAWYRICDRAQGLNLRRSLPHQGRARVNGYHRTMRYDDLEAVAKLGESGEEKERLCQIANELAQQTMRGGLSAHWWLPLEGVSYAGICIDEASEANDADLFNLSAFPCGVPPRVACPPLSKGIGRNITHKK